MGRTDRDDAAGYAVELARLHVHEWATHELTHTKTVLSQAAPTPTRVVVPRLGTGVYNRLGWCADHPGVVPFVAVSARRADTLSVATTRLDRTKQRDAINANFVHGLESWVLHEVVGWSARQHVDVLSVHDCFYAPPDWVRRTKLKYAGVLRDLLVGVTPTQFVGLDPTVKADVRDQLEGLWSPLATAHGGGGLPNPPLHGSLNPLS